MLHYDVRPCKNRIM